MDESRPSEPGSTTSRDRRRRYPGPGPGALVAAGTLVAGALVAAGSALASAASAAPATGRVPSTDAGAAATEVRFTGEHGLWVSTDGRSVVVRWITPEARRGVLEAYAGDRRLARVRTRQGFAHSATFRARGAERIVLRYGSLEHPEDQHRTTVSLAPPERPGPVVAGVDSLFILGDTHGYYDALVEGLQTAGLIDDALRWIGGRSHVAFAGDLTDRGPDVLGLLWLVYRLEREAAAAGGGVHIVLGNHEIMVMLGDLRYVHPKEMQVAELHGAAYHEMFDARESILGRWLASKPGLLRIDRVLIAHGGLGPLYADYELTEFEDSLRAFVGEELFHRWADTTWLVPMDSATFERRADFFWHRDSAFWHRDYVQTDTAEAVLERVLWRMDSDVFVVGHTAVEVMGPRYGGRVLAAHTPRHGAELLLLVRRPDGYDRYRVSAAGRERF